MQTCFFLIDEIEEKSVLIFFQDKTKESPLPSTALSFSLFNIIWDDIQYLLSNIVQSSETIILEKYFQILKILLYSI